MPVILKSYLKIGNSFVWIDSHYDKEYLGLKYIKKLDCIIKYNQRFRDFKDKIKKIFYIFDEKED